MRVGQIPSDDRARVFIPMFERFTKDASRWVRNGAFEVLGPFLHVLGSKLVSKEMLRYYTTIPELSNTVVDQEVTFFCAFNLPAVALTLGPDRWEGTIHIITIASPPYLTTPPHHRITASRLTHRMLIGIASSEQNWLSVSTV